MKVSVDVVLALRFSSAAFVELGATASVCPVCVSIVVCSCCECLCWELEAQLWGQV